MRQFVFGGLVALSLLVGATNVHASPVIYSQPFDGLGAAYSSQNDAGGFGNFATMYDNFTLGIPSTVTDVEWIGEYFNPATPGALTGFTISFWADNAGQPGANLSTELIAGTANETLIGTFGGFPTYSYSTNLGNPFAAAAGTPYWVSIVAEMAFPPQWGWSSGTGGDGIGYQDFMGNRVQQVDMAYSLTGVSQVPEVPEPTSMSLLGLGLLGTIYRLRRRQ